MAATGALWDLSGQSQQAANKAVTRQEGVTSAGSASASDKQYTGNTSITSGTNTPQYAQDAIQQLIQQLMGGPSITNEELDAKAPLLRSAWINPTLAGSQNGGWGLIDPLTGKQYRADDPAAQRLNAQRQAQRLQLTQESVQAPGTPATRDLSAKSNALYSTLEGRAGEFTKDQALQDASLLTGKFTRQLMEQLLPNINKAVEASGTTGGAVQGLLAQDAAARTAENQAALGLQTAVQYGQISNNINAIMADLIKAGDPNMAPLVQLLSIAKGTIDNRVSSSSQSTSSDKTIDENKNVNTNITQQGSGSLYGTLDQGLPLSATSSATRGTALTTGPVMRLSAANNVDPQTLLALLSGNSPSGITGRLNDFQIA